MSTTITPAQVQEALTEFASVSSDRIQFWIDWASVQVNESAWSNKYSQGVILLTGHYLKSDLSIGNSEAAAGPVQSESVGAVSVSYAISDELKKSELASTSYGRKYLQLRRLVFACRCL